MTDRPFAADRATLSAMSKTDLDKFNGKPFDEGTMTRPLLALGLRRVILTDNKIDAAKTTADHEAGAKATRADAIDLDPYTWDPDPVVVVSRRSRILYFPAAIIRAEPTADQRSKWLDPESLTRDRGEVHMVLNLGVTFLGTMTSKWLYRKNDDRGGQAPRSAPPPDRMILVEPQGPQARQAFDSPAFKDRETPGRRRPDLINAAWSRVIAYLSAADNPTSQFFRTVDGYDAPEILVLRISEVLGQTTEAGRQAYTHALLGAERCKDMAHLGALHDYAFRDRRASAIVAACRRRAQAVPESRL